MCVCACVFFFFLLSFLPSFSASAELCLPDVCICLDCRHSHRQWRGGSLTCPVALLVCVYVMCVCVSSPERHQPPPPRVLSFVILGDVVRVDTQTNDERT